MGGSGGEGVGQVAETESMLALAENVYVNLPCPVVIYLSSGALCNLLQLKNVLFMRFFWLGSWPYLEKLDQAIRPSRDKLYSLLGCLLECLSLAGLSSLSNFSS